MRRRSAPRRYDADIGQPIRTISLQNRQRRVKLNIAWLRRFAPEALALCEKLPKARGVEWQRLQEISAVLVSDAAIASAHEQFMGIAGATDVITFQHGELLISAETAMANADRYEHTVEVEIGLCLIHGVLHLLGYDDLAPADARLMRGVQHRLLRQCLTRIPPA